MNNKPFVAEERRFVEWVDAEGETWKRYIKENPFYYLVNADTSVHRGKDIERLDFFAMVASKTKSDNASSLTFHSKKGKMTVHIYKNNKFNVWNLGYLYSGEEALPVDEPNISLVRYLFAINQNGQSDLLDAFFQYLDESYFKPMKYKIIDEVQTRDELCLAGSL